MIEQLIATLLLMPGFGELGKTFGTAAIVMAAAFGGIAGTVRWYRRDKKRRVAEIAAQEAITQGRIDRAVKDVVDEHDKRLDLYKGNAEALEARLRIVEADKRVLQEKCDVAAKEISGLTESLHTVQKKTIEVVDLNLGLQGQLTAAQKLIVQNSEAIVKLERAIK